MTLIIIDAADVREGEPRWWFTTEAEARYWRTRPAEERGRFHDEYAKVPTGTASRWLGTRAAIVDRPTAAPTPASAQGEPVDIAAARRFAADYLAEAARDPLVAIGEDAAAFANVCRAVIACTPPSLAAAVKQLPEVGGSVDLHHGAADPVIVALEAEIERLRANLDGRDYAASAKDRENNRLSAVAVARIADLEKALRAEADWHGSAAQAAGSARTSGTGDRRMHNRRAIALRAVLDGKKGS